MADPQTLPLILRNSVTAGAVPAATEFDLNTFVVNRNDGILYWRDAAGAVQSINLRIGVGSGLSPDQKIQAKKNLAVLGTGYNYYGSNASILNTAVGNTLYVASGVTLTLPALSSMNNGDVIFFQGWGTLGSPAGFLKAAGSEYIANGQGGGGGQIAIRPGQLIMLTVDAGLTQWLAFGNATAQGDAPSFNEDQRPYTTPAQRRVGRLNLKARGSHIGGISSATTCDGNYWGYSIFIFNGNFTVTMPGIATAGNGDSIEFTNISGSPTTLSVASGDTNCNFYYGKGLSAKTYVLQAGASCYIGCDGNNFIVFNNFAAEAGALNADFAQNFSAGQRARLRQNMMLDGVNTVGINGNTALVQSQAGTTFNINSLSADNTIDLPLVSSTSNGDLFRFVNTTGYYPNIRVNQSVDQAGSAAIVQYNQPNSKTIRLAPGCTLELRSTGANWYVESYAPNYAAVQQGGISGTGLNKILIGWRTDAVPIMQVDATVLGRIWTDYNTAQSLQGTGYQKLPNGLILNWVRTAVTSDIAVNWAIAFPNTIMSYGFGYEIGDTNTTALYGGWISRINNTNFDWRGRVSYQGSSYQPSGQYCTLNVFAVGY